jgi:hypothetical protein
MMKRLPRTADEKGLQGPFHFMLGEDEYGA